MVFVVTAFAFLWLVLVAVSLCPLKCRARSGERE